MEMTSYDISGELMNFIDTTSFCFRFAEGHSEQLALGNSDVDNRVHMQHQWQCLFFKEGSKFLSLLA